MLSFKDGSTIKKYKVELEESEKAQAILTEILSAEQRTRKEEGSKNIFTNYGRRFNEFEVNLVDKGIETVSRHPYHSAAYSEWTLGDIKTETITYIAPYTLALGAENFTFGPYGYAALLKKRERSNEIVRVINDANIDELSRLLACFGNNPDALEIFLRTHYPDLMYLRKYLECIRLDQTEELLLESQTEETISTRMIEIATSNTEVARKLNLTFKGRNN